MRAVVFTLGCKVNEVESGEIMSSLEKMGFEVFDGLTNADLYVLNTCAVTAEAEKKSRQIVARARKFNPDAKIFVCGCASQKDEQPYIDRGVTFVTGAGKKQEIVSQVAKEFDLLECGNSFAKQTKTRAFIKIQDGCNNFCSYCIIPYLRGREKSRSVGDILREISVCTPYEIVLTGINMSSYNDGNSHLADLILAMKGVKKRIRLGSLECGIIDEKLLSALRDLNDFAPQFHLSLQSGSTAVLRSMNRHYSREQYLEKCRLIYSYFPDAAITTDIIVGFPTESESDFEDSLKIIDEANFSRIHAFAFSPREGTNAFKLKDLPPQVKSERLHKLLDRAKIASERYISRFIGRQTDFIAEEFLDGYTVGYSGNYIRLYVSGELVQVRKYNVRITKIYLDGAEAELIV